MAPSQAVTRDPDAPIEVNPTTGWIAPITPFVKVGPVAASALPDIAKQRESTWQTSKLRKRKRLPRRFRPRNTYEDMESDIRNESDSLIIRLAEIADERNDNRNGRTGLPMPPKW